MPHFTSKPDKAMAALQEEAVNFTWKLSNHSFNSFYFGTWNADKDLFDSLIMSLTRNASGHISYYTSVKEKVKEYTGRVRWVGDVSKGVASFELSNLKHSDQKYYGVEVGWNIFTGISPYK
jgi:hypothetical protein